MIIWQADFYDYLPQMSEGETQWKLTICDEKGQIKLKVSCSQSQANFQWLVQQFKRLGKVDKLKIFRPQIVNLFSLVGETLGFEVIPTRRTKALKNFLLQTYQTSQYNPLDLDSPPPQPLPEQFWGDNWRFASLFSGEIIPYFAYQPIPILEIDPYDDPFLLGIPSDHRLSGIIIQGGGNSMQLARRLGEITPYSLNYIPTEKGKSGGLVLESGLVDRWILATFEDEEIALSAQQYEQQKQENKGLHFLLIQPDDSGITYSGFWLLRNEG